MLSSLLVLVGLGLLALAALVTLVASFWAAVGPE